MKTALKIMGVLIALLMAASLYLLVKIDNAVSYSHHQRTTISTQAHEITTLQGSVANLIGQVQNPSNPLAAYTEVCSTTATNTSTGVDQTYYYPCTNNVIPATGN